MSKPWFVVVAATLNMVVGFGLGYLVFNRNEPSACFLSLGEWAQCSLQDVDASVLAVLAEAGCTVETHEFDATTGGKAAGLTLAGMPIQITYTPDAQQPGRVVVRAQVSGFPAGDQWSNFLSYQSFIQGLLVSACYAPKCSS